MKVRVDATRCKGYGVCTAEAPEVFDLDDTGKAFVVEKVAESVPAELAAGVRGAEMLCPERAIHIEDGDNI